MASSMVTITRKALDKLTLYARRARSLRGSEISGLGSAKRFNNKSVVIYDVWPVVHKEYGAAHVEIDPAIINQESAKYLRLQLDAIQAKKDGQPFDERYLDIHSNLRVWWHSHPQSVESYSGQDWETIESLSYLQGDWMVGVLTNGTFVKAVLQVYQPYSLVTAMSEPALFDHTDETKEIDKLVEECLPPKPVTPKYTSLGNDDWRERWGHGVGGQQRYASEEFHKKSIGPKGDDPTSSVLTGGFVKRNGIDPWDRWCNHKKCKNKPVVITDFNSQFCLKCAKQVGVPKKNIILQKGDMGIPDDDDKDKKDDQPTLPVGLI